MQSWSPICLMKCITQVAILIQMIKEEVVRRIRSHTHQSCHIRMLHFAVGEYKFHSSRCKFSEAETTRIRTKNRIIITSRIRSRSRRRRRSSSTFQKKNNLKDHQSAKLEQARVQCNSQILTQRGETDASSQGERSPVHMPLGTRRRRGRKSKAASEVVARPSLAALKKNKKQRKDKAPG